MSASGGTKAIVAALVANLGIAVTKFVAFLLTGSSSMLAESIHSVADSGNQGLLLVGGRRARREATPEHPFGYGRERYIYAFIVVDRAVQRRWPVRALRGLAQAAAPGADRRVAVGAGGGAGGRDRPGVLLVPHRDRRVQPRARRPSWVQFVRRAKAPELPVVLLEDLGALVGLVLALFGVGLTLTTDDGTWDGVGTICIGVLLVVIAVVLAVETKSLLLGEGATPEAVAPDRGGAAGRRRRSSG